MTEQLTQKRCIPCSGDTPPLTIEERERLLDQLPNGWEVIDEVGVPHLRKTFRFDSYLGGVDFVRRAAELAEEEGHHPDLHLGFKRVELDVWTHAINNLSESDFILAAKADEASQSL